MYQLQIIVNNKELDQKYIIDSFLYNNFRHAFTEAIDPESEISRVISDYKHEKFNPEKPNFISYASEMPDGYGDDFHLKYPDGITIVIGEAIIMDERKEH